MKENSVLELDLKRNPLVIIDEKLDDIKPTKVPTIKTEICENAAKLFNSQILKKSKA